MKKINLISVFIAAFLVIDVSAEVSPVQVSGGMTFSAFDDNMGDTEALGYKASMGYYINENVLFKLGYADFSAFSDLEINSLRAVMLDTELLLPVSEFASLYAGFGGALSNDDTNLTAAVGLKYQLSQNWYADVGYQGVFDLVRQQDDLYAFNTQLVYRFSNNKTTGSKDISPRPSGGKFVEAPTEVLISESESLVTINKEPLCQKELIEYRIVAGDYLLKLARMFDIPLYKLVEENSSLNNRDLDIIYPGEKVVYPKLSCLD